MSTENPRPDDPLDSLLARRYRETSPEFEARWLALKRDFRPTAAQTRRLPWPVAWLGWGAIALAATLAILLFRPDVPLPPAEPSPALAELFAMDSVLSRGTALLEAENRDALLHLPAPSRPRG
mgnify:CR=1 FL=1